MGEEVGDWTMGGNSSFTGIKGIKGVSNGEDRGKFVMTGGTAGIIFGELITTAEVGRCLELRGMESTEAEGRCRFLRGDSPECLSRSVRVTEGGRDPSLGWESCNFFKFTSSRMNPMKRFLNTHFPTFTTQKSASTTPTSYRM
jgi:hypothetical protein